jgi:5-oxopent-3-ene-1,2,5-tricarboxylate decarboxylase/2-hydroxyhepta-2,4-diene-1,7-dioate isomerase
MRLARVHAPDGRIALAARHRSGGLVLLDGIDGVDDDAVATLRRLGTARLHQLIDERAAEPGGVRIDEELADYAVPVPRPQKIICVALNYAEHAAEGELATPDEPVIFFKPPSSLLPHGGTVRNPTRSNRLDYEVELAVVIGERVTNVSAADWRDVVLGYTVFNDVTARDLQLVAMDRNQPWDHSKAFDTFAPCGPFLVTADEVPDPMDLALSLRVGDEVRQSSRTSYMIFDIPTLLEVISHDITLEPGDIIATGTPSGIGPVESGQVMTAEIEGIGRLVNPVVYEREQADAAVPA